MFKNVDNSVCYRQPASVHQLECTSRLFLSVDVLLQPVCAQPLPPATWHFTAGESRRISKKERNMPSKLPLPGCVWPRVAGNA